MMSGDFLASFFVEVMMKHILRYKTIAKDWNEALPIGSGKLGAMIYGDPINNHIQLNEDTVWYGSFVDRNNPNAYDNLPKIRELLINGQIEDAEELMALALSGTPESCRMYQTLGELYLDSDVKEYSEYERYLNIDDAIAGYSYKSNGYKYTVKIFASNVANCILININTDNPYGLNLKIHLSREKYFDQTGSVDSNGIYMLGDLSGNRFTQMIKAYTIDGEINAIGDRLCINKASEATLIYSAGTTFRYENTFESVKAFIDEAAKTSFEDNYSKHLDEYHSLYNRVTLDLDGNLDDSITTNEMLKYIDKYHKELSEIYFNFGRYLLISSSRKGSMPANLQGIWNKDMLPPWDSKYTININAEMNYWPAEICNLSECHMPLFELIKRMVPNGRVTAKKMYGCRGWVAHHNTDIYGDTAPVDIWIPGTYWVMGAAWLCTHIWKHYQYTKDLEFLREYYPIMEESALFFKDFLIEYEGYLVTCPSVSPENTYILKNGEKGCNGIGCTMDNQILRDLFNICIEAAKVLDINNSILVDINGMLCKLKPTAIGSKGQILEWREEYEEYEPGHRHISHLYGLHPSDQITPDKTPKLANAARKSLELRLNEGGGHTGWSRAWIINHYAKLWDGNSSYAHLMKLFENSTLPNMLDNHPPFQIDGNFGATAGIAEMLMQSNSERILILPALPDSLPKGELRGLKAVGNIEVNIKWDNTMLCELKLKSASNQNVCICYAGKSINCDLIAGIWSNIDFN